MVKKMLQFEKIGIGTLITLVLHTSAAIWYASNITTRVGSMEQQIVEIKGDVRDIRNHIMDKGAKYRTEERKQNASF